MRINRVVLGTELIKADMKSSELAEQAGVSVGTVSGIRSGRSCSKETAEKIAVALGVSLENLTCSEM